MGLWSLAAGSALLMGGPAFGQIAGQQVTSGSANFVRFGNTTTITTSRNAVINYSSFNIRGNETVQFVQPDSLSRVLNRINSTMPTQIDGQLMANGRVYIVNPSGVVFGRGAMINVGQMYAAAATISDSDFMRGQDRFITSANGKVVNEGTIQADVIGLIGRQVFNFGTLEAKQGTVMMVSGNEVMVGEQGGHVFARVESSPQTAVAGPEAPGAASASMSAKFGVGDVYALAVWNKGTVKGQDVQIESSHGSVQVAGTIDASDRTAGGKGGSVKVLGPAVGIVGAAIDASGDAGGGQVLIGGNFQGLGPERNATQTVVTQWSTIKADAISNGDGGKVIVWSDVSTKFDGAISARGGASGGDGGFAEISGKNSLVSNTNVDLGAPRGKTGTVLFDPENIQILGGTGDGSDDTDASDTNLVNDSGSNIQGTIQFADEGTGAPATFIVRESEIEGTNANIVLQARSSITTSGDFVGDEVLVASGKSLSLTTQNSAGHAGVIDLTSSVEGAGLLFRTQGAGGTITIQAGGADTGNIALGKLTTAGENIVVKTSNGSISLNGDINAGAGVLLLQSSGAITQPGGLITAATLGARGSSITLDSAGNNATVAGFAGAGGAVTFRNTDAFTLGPITGFAGVGFANISSLTTAGGNVLLDSNAGATGTGMTLNMPISAGGGTVRLVTGDGITQGAGATITAARLGVEVNDAGAVNPVALTEANDVAFFAAKSSGTGSLSFRDTNGYTIEDVTASGSFTGASGIDYTLASVTLTNNLNTVQQTLTNPVKADSLTLNGAGSFNLDDGGNSVAGSLSSSAGGDVTFVSDSLVNIGASTVGGTFAVEASDVDITGALSGGGLALRPRNDADDISIGADAAATFRVDLNDLGFIGAFTNGVTIGRVGGIASTRIGGATPVQASDFTYIQGGDGGIIIQDAVGATMNTGTKTLTLEADRLQLDGAADTIQGAGGRVVLRHATAGRNVEVGGASVDDATTFVVDSTELAVFKNGFASITIGRASGNAVTTGTTTINAFTFNDSVTVQSAVGSGTMTVAGALATAPAENAAITLDSGGILDVNFGVTSNGANIAMRGVDGISLDASVNAGAGKIGLVSGGGISQSAGGLTAASLGITNTAGSVTLAGALTTNDVDVLAVHNTASAGLVEFRDTDGVSVGTVSGTGLGFFTGETGVTTTGGGNVRLGTGSAADISIDNNISAVGGEVRLESAGGVVENSGALILASKLGVRADGTVTLTSENQVATVAIKDGFNGSAVQYKSFNGMTVGELNDVAGETIVGITSKEGDILVNSGSGGLSITRQIDAGSQVVRLRATGAGGIGQSASGTITAGRLGVQSVGEVDLRLVNDAPIFAANVTGVDSRISYRNGGTLELSSVTGAGSFTGATGVVTNVVGTDGDIFLSSALGMTIKNDINAGTGTVRLVSGAGISSALSSPGPTGRVIASALGINADGAVTLHADNQAGTIAIDAGTGSLVEYVSFNGLTVGSVGLGTFLNALDYTASSGIRTNAGGGISVNAGNGGFSITQAINAGAAGTVWLKNTHTTGTIGQSGSGVITAGTLGVRTVGTDAVALTLVNNVSVIAADVTGGALNFRAAGDLEVGGIGAGGPAGAIGFAAKNGITAGGDVLLRGAGNLSVGTVANPNVDINAGTATVRLVTTNGAITQRAGSRILAGALGARATGAITLTESGNDVDTLATSNTGGVTAGVSFRDTDDVSVGQVAADAGALFTSTTGISTAVNGDALLRGAGNLSVGTVANPAVDINAGTGTVRLVTTNGAITQRAGSRILAGALGARATGAITLTESGNDVNTLAAMNTGGATAGVSYRDANGVEVGQVAADAGALFATTAGITTAVNGDALLRGAGDLTVGTVANPNVDINAGTGTVRLVTTGGAITQRAGSRILAGALGARATGDVTLTESGNDVNTFAAANTSGGAAGISFRDTDDVSVGQVAADAGALFATTTGIATSGNGDVLLRGAGDLTVGTVANPNVDINAGTGTVRLVTTNGAITQRAGSRILAGALGARATGDITLTESGNDVNTFAAANTGGGTAGVSFRDTDDLSVGQVANDAGGLFTTTTGITTSVNGDVFLGAGAGGLAINESINAGAGTVRLLSGGTVTQGASGTINAGSLGVRASGDATLLRNNLVTNNVAADVSGSAGAFFSYNDGLAINVGNVSAGGPGGVFLVTNGINTSAGGGTRLRAGNSVTQTNAITGGGSLGVISLGGSIDLTNTSNEVGTFSGSVTVDFLRTIAYRDSNGFTVGAVGAITGFEGVSGVGTAGGDVFLGAGSGNLAIDQTVNAVGGTVRLLSGGTITEGASGTISAGALGVRASGEATLLRTNFVTDVAADVSGSAGAFFNYNDGLAINVGSVSAGGPGGVFLVTNGINTSASGGTRLRAGNSVTQTNAITGGGSLGVISLGGSIDLTHASNNVGTFSGSVTVDFLRTIKYSDSNTLTVGSVGAITGFEGVSGVVTAGGDALIRSNAGTLTLNDNVNVIGGIARLVSGGAIDQTGGIITASGLGVNAAGAVTLNQPNKILTLAVSDTGTGAVNFLDDDGFVVGTVGATLGVGSVGGVTTADGDVLLSAGSGGITLFAPVNAGARTVRLSAGGGIGQGFDIINFTFGTITANELGVRAGGSVLLLMGNDVNTFAATTGAVPTLVDFRDSDDLTVGTVGGITGFAQVDGISTGSGGSALIATGGPLTLAQTVNVGTGALGGTVRLDSGGLINQTGGTIQTRFLGARGAGAITLSQAGNNAEVFAAANSGAGGEIRYADANGFALDQVTASGTDFLLTTGIVSNNQDVLLDSGTGGLSLLRDLNAGTGTVRLKSGASITQGGGAITAQKLGMIATGSATLNQLTNNVDVVAASTGAEFEYRDTNGFAIGTVTALGTFTPTVTGITSGDVLLDSAGGLDIGAAITSTGTVRIVATGNVTQSAGVTASALGVITPGNVDLQSSANHVGTFGAAVQGTSTVEYADFDALTIGPVSASVSGRFGGVAGVSTAGGNAILKSGAGLLTLAGDLNVTTSGAARLISGAGINQTGGSITANQLGLRAAGDVTINGTSNTVDLLAAVTTSGKIEYQDGDGLLIDTVGTAGAFTAVSGVTTSGGAVNVLAHGTFDVNNDVATSGGDITLDTSVGSLTLRTGSVNSGPVGGTGVVTLRGSGGVFQTVGTITANGLNVQSTAGGVALDNAGNNVGTLAGQASFGSLSFRDLNDLTVGLVGATNGVAANGDLTLIAGGGITLDNVLVAGPGTIRLQAAGQINQTAGTVTGAALGIRAGGPVTLLRAGNDVGIFAATSSAAGAAIQYRDGNDLTVGTVTGSGTFIGDVIGVTTAGANSLARVLADGSLTVSNAVATTDGDVFLGAGTALTTSAAVSAAGAGRGATLDAASMTIGGTVSTVDGNVALNSATGALATTGAISAGGAGRTASLISAGAMTVDAAVSAAAGSVDLNAGTTLTTTGAGTITAGGVAGTANLASNGSMTVGGAVATTDGNVLLNSGGIMAVNAPVTAGGASRTATLTSGDDLTLAVGAPVTANGAVAMSAAGTMTVNDDVSGQTLVLSAGTDGTGNLQFGAAGVDLSGNSITLQAGDGPGLPDSGFVNAVINGPVFHGAAGGATNPVTFSMIQDADLTDGLIPLATQFGTGNVALLDYRLSSQGRIDIDSGGKFTGSDLVLAASTIRINTNFLDVHSVSISGTTNAQPVDVVATTTFLAVNGDFTIVSGSITVNSGTLAFNGRLDVTNGPLSLTADQINFAHTITSNGTLTLTANEIDFNLPSLETIGGTGELIIRPRILGTDIRLGEDEGKGGGNPNAGILDLTSQELDHLQNGFSKITIGDNAATGLMEFFGPVTFSDPVEFRMAGAGGRFRLNAGADLTGTDNASFKFFGSGGGVTLRADIITAGDEISIDDKVFVEGSRKLDTSTGANIAITGTIDTTTGVPGALRLLAGSGDIALGGDVGGADQLSSLDATGSSITLRSVHTTGHQAYNGNVRLGASAVAMTTGGATGADIDFNGTVDSAAGLSGNSALNVNAGALGEVSLGGNVGSGKALTSLTLNGQNVQVTAPTVAITTTNGVTLGTTMNGASAVTINTGAGSLALGGSVGQAEALTSFAVNGHTDLNNPTLRVKTTGVLAFNGTMSGASDLTLQSTGGPVSIAGAATGLKSLAASGPSVSVHAVNTTGSQTYTGATTLNGNLDSTGGGTISVTGDTTLDGDVVVTTHRASADDISFSGTIDGAHMLAADAGAGDVTFGGAVGQDQALTKLFAAGNTVSVPTVTTTLEQAYAGTTKVTLNGDLTCEAGPITVAGPARLKAATVHITAGSTTPSPSADINFVNTLDVSTDTGAPTAAELIAVTQQGHVRFVGAVGSVKPLENVFVQGAGIELAGVTTQFDPGAATGHLSGHQAYSGAITLSGNLTANGGPITLNGPTVLNGTAITVNAGGNSPSAATDISFLSTVDGASNLAVTAGSGQGDVLFAGNVGTGTALTSLTATANTVRAAANVQSTGAQSYSATAILEGGLIEASRFRVEGGKQTILGSNTTGSLSVVHTTGTDPADDAVFTGPLYLVGDSKVVTNQTAFFGSTVESATASRTATGAKADANRSLTVESTLGADIVAGTTISNVVPIMFNGNVGGDFDPSQSLTQDARDRMLSTVSLNDVTPGGVSKSSTIVIARNNFTNAADNVLLSADGHITIPTGFRADEARFDSGSGITGPITTRFLTTQQFTMGQNQKLLSVGSLLVWSGGNATLSDMSSLWNINVVANGTIKILGRTSAPIATNLFANGVFRTIPAPGLTPTDDVDFVALNSILFTTPNPVQVTTTGTRRARFSTPNTGGGGAGLRVNGARVVTNELLAAEFRGAKVGKDLLIPSDAATFDSTGTFRPLVGKETSGMSLDLGSGGLVTVGLGAALAGALPSDQGRAQAQQGVGLAGTMRSQLKELDLYVKDADTETVAEARRTGRLLINDVPHFSEPQAQLGEYLVTTDRLNPDAVKSVLDAYYALIGDAQTRADRLAAAQEAIGNSWRAYNDTLAQGAEPDPYEFRRFVEGSPEHKETLDALNKIGLFLRRFDQLAISPVEAKAPRDNFLKEVNPQQAGMSIQQLEAAARGQPQTAASR